MGLGMTRRGFLAGLTATVAFRDTAWASIAQMSPKNTGPEDEAFWAEVRNHFIFHEKMTSFNHVGLAPPPKAAYEEQLKQLKRAASIPTQIIWREQIKEIEAVRNRLAPLIGAKPEETALTYNASYGLQTGIMGWPLQKGDAIVTSSHDYSRAFTAIKQRARRDGIMLVEIPVQAPPESKEKILESWSDALKPNVKLAVLCTVTFLNGQILPVKEIIELCHSRGVAVLLDGAQSIGLLPTELDKWKPEMYTACLHKWLMAPIATGVFSVPKNTIKKVWSLSPSEESLENDITKFEQVGTRPLAPILAINQAIDFHEWLGMELKFKRLQYLRERIGKGLFEEQNIVNFGSLDPTKACAMVTVGFKGKSGIEASGWLANNHSIHVTTTLRAGIDAIRISPNVFTSLEEVDRLVKAIREFAES